MQVRPDSVAARPLHSTTRVYEYVSLLCVTHSRNSGSSVDEHTIQLTPRDYFLSLHFHLHYSDCRPAMRASQLLLTLGWLAPPIYAQTASQLRAREIQACANSIDMTSYDSPVSYQVDDTALYEATYTYDIKLCNPTTPIPIARPTLQNLDTMNTVSCTAVSFGQSGILVTQCSKSQ